MIVESAKTMFSYVRQLYLLCVGSNCASNGQKYRFIEKQRFISYRGKSSGEAQLKFVPRASNDHIYQMWRQSQHINYTLNVLSVQLPHFRQWIPAIKRRKGKKTSEGGDGRMAPSSPSPLPPPPGMPSKQSQSPQYVVQMSCHATSTEARWLSSLAVGFTVWIRFPKGTGVFLTPATLAVLHRLVPNSRMTA